MEFNKPNILPGFPDWGKLETPSEVTILGYQISAHDRFRESQVANAASIVLHHINWQIRTAQTARGDFSIAIPLKSDSNQLIGLFANLLQWKVLMQNAPSGINMAIWMVTASRQERKALRLRAHHLKAKLGRFQNHSELILGISSEVREPEEDGLNLTVIRVSPLSQDDIQSYTNIPYRPETW